MSAPTAETSAAVEVPALPSLRRNISWTLAGNIVYAGCQWGMLVAIARIGTPELVGRFTLALAITAPIVIFSRLSLRNVQATDARKGFDFSDYFALRLITTGVAISTIIIVALGSQYGEEARLVIIAVGVAKGFEAISDIVYGLMQQCERMDRAARLQIANGPISILSLAGTLYCTGSLLFATAALAAAWGLRLLAYDLPAAAALIGRSQVIPSWRVRRLLHLLQLALPLGFVAALISLNGNMPRYFLDYFGGERQLGIFAAMAYLVVVGGTLVEAIAQAAVPRLARHAAAGDKAEFVRLLLILSAIALAIGTVGIVLSWLCGRTMLATLYGPEYARHFELFQWIAVAGAISFLASALCHGIMAARLFRTQLLIYGSVVMTSVLACYILVPGHGPKGAAWAMATSFGIQILVAGLVYATAVNHRLNAVREKNQLHGVRHSKKDTPVP